MSKTKPKHDKPVSLKEERDAAKLEIIREQKPISASGLKKVNRVHEINKLLDPLNAEKNVLRDEIFREMDNKGVDVLSRKGIPVVSRDEAVMQNVAKDVLLEKYPEIATEVIITKTVYRVNWKKPLFLSV